MDKSVLIQKQIKDNNEDLQNYMRDLKLWEAEMKRKDHHLIGNTSENDVLPPVRRKKKKTESVPKQEVTSTKRIAGYDYSSWDKFDVDKACEEVDKDSSDESLEENYADEATVKREQALYEKAIGNRYVQDNKWDEAISAYSRAITSDPNDAIFYANRALCYLKQNKWKEAEADCTSSIQLDSKYVKAYQRRAEGRKQLGKFEEAKEDLLTIIKLEPKNKLAQHDLENLVAKIKPVLVKTNPILPKTQTISTPVTKKERKVPEIEKSQPSTESEPLWSSSSETCLIEPINKPPHLRSKKPLKRIPIIEVNSILTSKCTNVTEDQIQPIKENPLKSKQEFSEPTASTAQDIVTQNKGNFVECNDDLPPPPPKTSVQFEICWRKIKNNRSQCYRFLKQIRGKDFPLIFKESLESNTFSGILDVLSSEFIAARDNILDHLEGLSQVRRFGSLVMFMSSYDKSNLIKLFDHCKALGECSEESISRLKKVYEI